VYKILLTGSSGFIGFNIINSFSEKFQFYIIVRKKPLKKFLKRQNISVIKFSSYKNLNTKLKKLRVDTVIHCATHYVKNHEFSDIKKFCNSNLLFGNIILENLEIMKVKKFINFSTVWEDSNAKKDNIKNLYAAYKKSFGIILGYYQKNLKKVNFYELMVSDTFGNHDNRKKLITTLKNNYFRNKSSIIASRNLYMNLLNVLDINNAISLIIKKNIAPKKYLLTNNSYIKIFNLVKLLNKQNKKKFKVKWLSSRLIKDKIYPYDKLKGWKPKNSYIRDIINYIKS